MSADRGLVLVTDDDAGIRALVGRWLERGGFSVETFESGEACVAALARALPDAVCLDLHMPGAGGLETLRLLKERLPRLPILILTADDEVSSAVGAMQAGAWDYLTKPLARERLLTTVGRAVEQHRLQERVLRLEREAAGVGYPGILGDSGPMRELFRRMDRVAPTDVSILLQGESGTGKELVARALHDGSGRRAGPFIALNCAAIPASLQEAELFGHEKGAFTGAAGRRAGRFEQADGGTLFLDEVAELSSSLQASLLRVLQERTFHRVGGSHEVRSDFRLVAASHRDLAEEVRAGRFREDLFFRLAVFELRLPPLRDRGNDLFRLAEHFVAELAQRRGGGVPELTEGARAVLARHPWPGNVRELHNVVQHAMVVATDGRIGEGDLPPRLRTGRGSAPPADSPPGADDPFVRNGVPLTLAELETAAIRAALERTGGRVRDAADQLGMGRATLYRKLKELGLR